MHQRLLVTFNKELCKTSAEAREYVYKELSNDPSFIAPYDAICRFGGGIADYFVIGGRWSGVLLGEGYITYEEETNIIDALNQQNPDEFMKRILGRDEDAQIVTQEIYENFLAEYEDNPCVEECVDLNWDAVSPSMIGTKWIVVVDYHH